MADHVQLFLDFIRKSPSAFHAVKTLCAALDAGAAGAISGSAVVRLIEKHRDDVPALRAALRAFAASMKTAARKAR